LLLTAIPIANVVQYRSNSLAVLIWGASLSIFVVAVGLYLFIPPTTPLDGQQRAERLRWILLLTAGGVGALTALLGLVLPFCSLPMAMTDYVEIFKGGPKEWRDPKNTWPIVRCVGAVIGGLVLMFVGLQLARPVQRTSMNMRRWLYGYNAVLSSLLLLFILALVNLLPYTGVKPFTWAMEATDWTADRLFTLQPATKNMLAEIKEPIKVYVIMREGALSTRQTETLMNNCRAVNPQLSWEELSPDQNPLEFDKLRLQYSLPERFGLLIVYGTPPNPRHQFIESKDLFASSATGDPESSFDFKGEQALVKALTQLTSTEAQGVVYFTQGYGELDFNEQGRRRIDAGAGLVQDELSKINYQPKALALSVKTTSIPEDADILVIAGPREEYPANVLKALRAFLGGEHRKDNKKGKLMVLLDVAINKGQMVHTGLEPLLAEYGVKVNDNRLMSAVQAVARLRSGRDPNPLPLGVVADRRSTSPVARTFSSGDRPTQFTFYDARSLEALSRPGGRYTVENLVVTLSQQTGVWIETDLKANPTALALELLRDQEKLVKRLTDDPVVVGVAVTEGKTPPPMPGHPPLPNTEGEPRLIVFGDASWASNAILYQATPDNFALFSSCLAWLSGRHDIGEQIPASTRNMYRLKLAPGESWGLVLLPGALMLFGVVALGFGVWVVRRR
jgi:hypothetical protein